MRFLSRAVAPRGLRASMALVVAALLPLTCLPHAAQATPLVADLSTYRINIDSGFSGTRIFLFGARNDNGDVVVVIRGPQKDFIVRKKKEIAGIWVNRDRMKLFQVPDYYAVASSRPLKEIEQSMLFDRLRIGEAHLIPPPVAPKALAKFDEFSNAFLEHQRTRKLYMHDAGVVQFMGETLFKTEINFPDDIPSGNYTAEIYLIGDGEIVGMQSTPIQVVKSGLDAFLYHYAHQSPALYGLTAIVLALAAGWFTGRLFEKL